MTAVNALLADHRLSPAAYALLAGADFGGGCWDLLARGRGGTGTARASAS